MDLAHRWRTKQHEIRADPPTSRITTWTDGDITFKYVRRHSQASFAGDLHMIFRTKSNPITCRSLNDIYRYVESFGPKLAGGSTKCDVFKFPEYETDGVKCLCNPRCSEPYANVDFDGSWTACGICDGWYHDQCVNPSLGMNGDWVCDLCKTDVTQMKYHMDAWEAKCVVLLLSSTRPSSIFHALGQDIIQCVCEHMKPVLVHSPCTQKCPGSNVV